MRYILLFIQLPTGLAVIGGWHTLMVASHITLGIHFGFFHSLYLYLGLYPVHFVSSPFVALFEEVS